jgi:hypothetical protein
MPKPLVFLTHVNTDAELASAIKKRIEDEFLGGVEVFASSDPGSLKPGDHWLDSITTSLKDCSVQILLLSRLSLTRTWVYFEAGAAWAHAEKVQIPLCFPGVAHGQLPLPLGMLQAGSVNDPSYLRSMFQRISDAAGLRLPKVDFEALASEWGDLAGASPEAIPEVATSVGILNADSRSLVVMREPPSEKNPRLVVLSELRGMRRAQASSSAILDLDLTALANTKDVPREDLQNELVDALAMGYAEPYAATMGQSAEQGACRITGAGLAALELMEQRGTR